MINNLNSICSLSYFCPYSSKYSLVPRIIDLGTWTSLRDHYSTDDDVFCPFSNSIAFLLLNFETSLYVLNISTLLDMLLAKNLFQFVACFFFIFFTKSFVERQFFLKKIAGVQRIVCFFLMDCAFSVMSKDSSLSLRSWRFSSIY